MPVFHYLEKENEDAVSDAASSRETAQKLGGNTKLRVSCPSEKTAGGHILVSVTVVVSWIGASSVSSFGNMSDLDT